MTEEEWLACEDPHPMLRFLRGRVGSRKLRLFAAACGRRVWPLLPAGSRRTHQAAVEVAERYADGRASPDELIDALAESSPDPACEACAASAYPDASQAASWAAGHAALAAPGERPAQARILRDLLGPLPFRRVAVSSPWLVWSGGTVVSLAEAAYEHRALPAGTLDPTRLAVLADALEEAGCEDAAILGHLRGPGPHVRGCFLIDALLAKE